MKAFDLLLAFSLSSIACFLLMPLLIKYAHVLGMMDAPGERKVHQLAIPRTGGVAIALSALLTTLLLVTYNSENVGLILGVSIIIVFGLLDDALDLHYGWKFLGQFLAVGVVLYQGIQLHTLPFLGINEAPFWLSIPISVLFIIGVTNAVNLSDGLDGLAAGTMLLTYAYIAIFAAYSGGTDVAVIAIAVGGGLFGFLRYNTHPAVVFMGDTGSQFIGFVAVCLSILLTQRVNPLLNPSLPLLILGLPILDTLSVMIQRIRAGSSPFSPDKRHIHHKLLTHGFQHPHAVAMIYLIQSTFLMGAFVFRYAADWQVIGYYGLVSAAILGSLYLAGKYHWNLAARISDDRRSANFLRKPWIFDFCAKYIETALIVFLFFAIVVVINSAEVSGYIELLIILLSLGGYTLFSVSLQAILVRISIYVAGTSIIYVNYSLPFSKTYVENGIYLFGFLLVIVTSLAVRVTRRAYFRLNNQDLLVILLFLVATSLIQTKYIVQGLIYLCCLGYATEYLLHRENNFKILRLLALISLLNLVLFVWRFN